VPVIYSMGNFVSHMKYDVNNDTFILQMNLKRGEDGQIHLASHQLHPATVLTDMTVKESAGATSGKTRTDNYIVVPQEAQYRSLISGSTTEVREDLAYMDASLARFETVFEGRRVLPLPYDPYGLDGSEDDAPALSLKGTSSRFHWLLRNLEARTKVKYS